MCKQIKRWTIWMRLNEMDNRANTSNGAFNGFGGVWLTIGEHFLLWSCLETFDRYVFVCDCIALALFMTGRYQLPRGTSSQHMTTILCVCFSVCPRALRTCSILNWSPIKRCALSHTPFTSMQPFFLPPPCVKCVGNTT